MADHPTNRSPMSRIAIIGAGPIGLEAALLATKLGHDVQVFEKGRVAENILDWGHVRLFSPFGMNSSEWGRGALANAFGLAALPHDDALFTGCEFAECYLLPLSRLPELEGRVHEQCSVCSISRQQFRKTQGIGSADRARQPFQLLVEQNGDERIELADVVLDCSGTYPHHQWLGEGGMPCLGERRWLSDQHYRLPTIDAARFGNRTTAVIGSGFSAATAVTGLAALTETHPRTRVFWFAKSATPLNRSSGPIARVPNDPLIERDRLTTRANELASSEQSPVTWLEDVTIQSLRPFQSCRDVEGFHLQLDRPVPLSDDAEPSSRMIVDHLIANVGYRPDRSIYEELHVHECYASQGPIKLAAKLLGESSADCLAQASHGADVLKNPEPNFFILGSKSYGRNSNFLLRVGHQQIREVFEMLKDGMS